MEKDTERIDLIFEGYLHYLRNISIDNVILSYDNEEFKVLLYFHPIQKWAITGGFIERTETLDEAAQRLVRQRTGLDKIFSKQFKAFGGPERHKNSFAKEMNKILPQQAKKIPDDNWLNEFFVTIGYYSLVEKSKVDLSSGFDKECSWWNVNELPPLMADHNSIIECALDTLKHDLYHLPVARELLPRKFTLPELQTLYETILGKKLDRGNFYKKMKSLGWLIKLYEQKKVGAHKSPYLHMFDPEV